jgi:hypothetical protein
MKKSYHSMVVPTMVAIATRRSSVGVVDRALIRTSAQRT